MIDPYLEYEVIASAPVPLDPSIRPCGVRGSLLLFSICRDCCQCPDAPTSPLVLNVRSVFSGMKYRESQGGQTVNLRDHFDDLFDSRYGYQGPVL